MLCQIEAIALFASLYYSTELFQNHPLHPIKNIGLRVTAIFACPGALAMLLFLSGVQFV
jgi:hypothetical protein